MFAPAKIKAVITDLLGITSKGQATKTNSLPVTLASDDNLHTILGTTNASAVEGDADGSIKQALRGIAKVLGAFADSAATAGGTGSISGKLRGLTDAFGAKGDVADETGNIGFSLMAKAGGIIKRLTTAIGLLEDVDASLGTISGQLPPALGVQAQASSLSIVKRPNIDRDQFSSGAVPGTTDITVSTASINPTAGIAPTTGFFSGASMSASPRWVHIPVLLSDQGGQVALYFYNDLGAGDVALELRSVTVNNGTPVFATLDSVTVPNGNMLILGPAAGGAGAGANYRSVPALASGVHEYLTLQITPPGTTSGGVRLGVTRYA